MQENNSHNRVVNILEFKSGKQYHTLEFKSDDEKAMVYRISDEVTLPDGVYFAHNGFFTVYLGRIAAAFARSIPCSVFDRHGNSIPYPL